MIPVVCDVKELKNQLDMAREVYKQVLAKFRLKKIRHKLGTMIEIPRAALGRQPDSRRGGILLIRDKRPDADDVRLLARRHRRIRAGLSQEGNPAGRPVPSIDQTGVGELIKIGIERGRKTRKDLEVGICGEHGGEPASVEFCHKVGMNYVSCSPFRVPIARLAAAQAVVNG